MWRVSQRLLLLFFFFFFFFCYIVYVLLADPAAATALEAESVIKGKFKTAQVMTEPVLANVFSLRWQS